MAIEIFEVVCDKHGWVRSGDKVDIELSDGRRQFVEVEKFDHQGEAMMRRRVAGIQLNGAAKLRLSMGPVPVQSEP